MNPSFSKWTVFPNVWGCIITTIHTDMSSCGIREIVSSFIALIVTTVCWLLPLSMQLKVYMYARVQLLYVKQDNQVSNLYIYMRGQTLQLDCKIFSVKMFLRSAARPRLALARHSTGTCISSGTLKSHFYFTSITLAIHLFLSHSHVFHLLVY